MISADIILPVTTANLVTYLQATVALRTCQCSTSGRLHIYNNNVDEGEYTDRFHDECKALSVRYTYVPGPFSMSKTYNRGFDETDGEYIAYACQDVIYFPCWLENIIEQFKKDPSWYYLSNYSFDTHVFAATYHSIQNEARVVATPTPGGGTIVFKRSNNFRWDEQFPQWELDADLYYHMRKHGLKGGCVLNSRCDHFVCGVRGSIDQNKAFGTNDFVGEAQINLKRKWGLE